MNKELKDLMMYMIGFTPITNGIFEKVYEDQQGRWSIKTVNELIDMCNHMYGCDIKKIEVKEE